MTERDRGSITAFVVALTVAFVACAALAVDGGRLVAAKVDAADHAENAARVGGQELTQLRAGVRAIDPVRARARASAYLREHGLDGDVVATAQSVTVTVVVVHQPTLLALVGVGPRAVAATRSAAPFSTDGGPGQPGGQPGGQP